MNLSASIISVGTEITLGQITNRNCQWISQKLMKKGIPTRYHLVVPDDRALIFQTLDIAKKNSELIFVTGGLGPTSDDFTREVIAEWAQTPLVFHEPSWEEIKKRLAARGVPVRDMQKQQCLFPENAQVLLNRLGTANAFFLKNENAKIFVLPGPPREIEALWNDEIETVIKNLNIKFDPLQVQIWDTMGLGESEIAARCVEALQDCPYDIGYRVHLPYVEVKMAYPDSELQKANKYLTALEKVLGPLTVARDGEDLVETLVKQWQDFAFIKIGDEISGAYLIGRLTPFLKNINPNQSVQFNFFAQNSNENLSNVGLPDSHLILRIKNGQADKAVAEISVNGQSFSEVLTIPSGFPLGKDRQTHYFVEKSVAFWVKKLATLKNN